MDLGDKELKLTPISGNSGKAFMGSYPDGNAFYKMNTSPILPGLAKDKSLHNYFGFVAYQMVATCVRRNG